jgi:hypothetical protein
MEQLINLKFLVKFNKICGRNGETIDAVENLTENEKRKNIQVASQGNEHHCIRHQKRNHD